MTRYPFAVASGVPASNKAAATAIRADFVMLPLITSYDGAPCC
jgi:hypothetical protein